MRIKEGLYGVYKPLGFTSRQIVNRIQEAADNKKTGHAGTLDPLAEGVLVVGVGRKYTKQLHTKKFSEKEYVALIKLGAFSTTDDREGEKEYVELSKVPSVSEVEKIISSMKGEIEQTPPVYSAVKIKGREAYKWAREGVSVGLPKRKVNIKEIELISFHYPFLRIRAITGPGVYIRTLARDLGKKLRTGGYLYHLKRTRVGDFKIENCKFVK